jgi:hypothetical protein
MSSKKQIEFLTNNKLQISKMELNKMLLLSHKLSSQISKSCSKQLKIKCWLKTKEKFQDKKSNKYKHYRMKLKKSTILKEILQLQKFKMQTSKIELISSITT